MAALALEIVTPTRGVYAGTASEVTLPGDLGEMGILPGHLPLVSLLQAGELVAQTTDEGERHFAVGSGFVQVGNDTVTVLVDFCEGADEIDQAQAREALAALEKDIDADNFKTKAELDKASAHAARERARISIVDRATKR